jgi:hypothetical protein
VLVVSMNATVPNIDIGGNVQYMALIYLDETATDALSADEQAALSAHYDALAGEARSAGVLRGGAKLSPIRDATTVRVRDAQTLVVDGPYAEAREVLGGYFVFECGSMDEALDWAARIPAAERVAVEVRPVHSDPLEG